MKRRRSPSRSIGDFKGHLWASGRTNQDHLAKAEEALGREWFAITAFPLFAGTFGPIASALNICALVGPWRCELAPGPSEEIVRYIPDPKWLIAINAISLFFGAIGNLSILLVSDDRAAPLHKYIFRLVLITIIGGFLASFLLIALIIVTATSLRLPSPPGYAYTQAYCYAIMSAVLYFATSSFVIYTAYIMLHTPRSRRELSLFAKGHRVKILTTAFMAYILIGAVIFSKVEGWSYLDGVFWADVTILTVGFGDFKPETHLGRCLLFPYAVFGIFILFLVIYCLTEVVFERGKSMWELRLRDQERIRRVQRREVQGRAKTSGSSINANEKSIEAIAAPALFEESCVSPKQARKRADREARRRDFNVMQEIIRQAARRRIFYSIFLWIFAALFLWLVGAVIFQHCEEAQQQWTYFNALYFTFVALLAIGYGDDTLHSASGKAFFVLWSLIVVPTLTMLISTGSQAVGTPYLLETKGWMRKKMTKKEPPKIQKHLSSSVVASEQLSHNAHDKNHLLVQAIKTVAHDHINQESGGARRPDYSFEDWEYIFYLMGILDPTSDEDEAPLPPDGSGIPRPPTGRSFEEWRDGKESLDWLHWKNPLNNSGTLTEWMLFSMVEKLEMELADLRRQLGNTNPVVD